MGGRIMLPCRVGLKNTLWGRYQPVEYINIPLGGYLEFDVTNTQDTKMAC